MLTNSGILIFVDNAKWLNHRREYAYGQIFPLAAPIGRIPPFQFSRALGETGVINLTLVRRSDGQEYSIQTEMTLTGLASETVATAGNEIGYEHVMYPGSAALPISGFSEGLHYLRFEDDMGEYWLSEYFAFVQDLNVRRDYVKVEWWHNENVTFSGGRIKYTFPYKNWAWLFTDIGKPDYQVTERVEARDGIDFPLQTIMYKVHRFNFLSTEYLLDAMHLIRGHDHVEVTHMGRVIGAGDFDKIFSFLLTPEWQEQGDVAAVDVEFRSNRVVIVNGRAYEDLDYDEGECGCLTINYSATAWIDDGSPEFAGGFWTDEGAVNHSFETGQYAIVVVGGFDVLRQWNGTSFISTPITARQNVCTVHDSRNPYVRDSFYFYRSTANAAMYQIPVILSDSNVDSVYTISGDTFTDSLIEVWLRTDTDDILAATFTDTDFESGITFDASGSNAYMVRARTYICENIGETDWSTFEGIGWWEIENDFEVQPDPGPPDPDTPEFPT